MENKALLVARWPAWLVTGLLVACGGSSDDSKSPTHHRVIDFDVIGNSADVEGRAPIVGGADFTVAWSVEDDSRAYLVGLAVSADEQLSSDDFVFLDTTCGDTDTLSGCREADHPLSLECHLNNSNTIFCQIKPGDEVDLTDFLDQTDKEAVIFIETCTTDAASCSRESYPVIFK